ncbi:hypothetical protein [Streptomyces bluensis]
MTTSLNLARLDARPPGRPLPGTLAREEGESMARWRPLVSEVSGERAA